LPGGVDGILLLFIFRAFLLFNLNSSLSAKRVASLVLECLCESR
jgi:hypothetical protein